jgi:hypothetical protein
MNVHGGIRAVLIVAASTLALAACSGEGPSPHCEGPDCPLPDLAIDEAGIAANWRVSAQTFSQASCEVVEKCVGAPGRRMLLRFDLRTPNVGEGDLYLGSPEDNPLFEYSPCHRHYHFSDYARYRLVDGSGRQVAAGHKQAFCLRDSERIASDAPPSARYTCRDQGLQAGWADTYAGSLPCQWIDITGVPPGDYMIEVRVNEARGILESSYDNNVSTVPVRLDAALPLSTGHEREDPPSAAACEAGGE